MDHADSDLAHDPRKKKKKRRRPSERKKYRRLAGRKEAWKKTEGKRGKNGNPQHPS